MKVPFFDLGEIVETKLRSQAEILIIIFFNSYFDDDCQFDKDDAGGVSRSDDRSKQKKLQVFFIQVFAEC